MLVKRRVSSRADHSSSPHLVPAPVPVGPTLSRRDVCCPMNFLPVRNNFGEYNGGVELSHIRYFVAAAEELHFGRAARRLHVTQPSLSKRVAGLERELGVRLFHRTRREVRLTEAGEIFLEGARRVLEDALRAAEEARKAGRGELGRLEIGFFSPAIYGVLPEILKGVPRAVPGGQGHAARVD